MNIASLYSKIMKRVLGFLYMVGGKFIALEDKTVMFFTFQGQYTCNPKYICDALHSMDSGIKCVWVVFDKSACKAPDYVQKVVFGTSEYYKLLYRSKVLVDNAFNYPKLPFTKKDKQYYVETMHGSLGIKRIGADSNRTKKRNNRGYKSAAMTDYIISNSTFEDGVYRTSFWETTPILKYGHARNDILVSKDPQVKINLDKKVRDHYGLPADARLALYAPTFMRESSKTSENLDLLALKDSLENKLGGTWYILNRLHPRDSRRTGGDTGSKFILDGNSYADIQELMVAIDVGITDFSSWIYDYVITEKFGIIYAPDLKEYEATTGLYYPITSTPFLIALNNEEMKSGIANFDFDNYSETVKAFVDDKGCIDDGNASARAAEMILGLLKDQRPTDAF